MRRLVILVLAVLAAAYLAVVLLMWWQQDLLVFAGAGLGDRSLDTPSVHALELRGYGDLPFRVAECVPEAPRGLLLFFVGNREDLCAAGRQAAQLAAYGLAVVAPEYPGYGTSAGQPGVASLLATADAAAGYAERRAKELGVPFLVGGSSLGTFCAVHTAAQGRATRLLLRAPPTTMVDAAAQRFWWLPVRMLLRHRFDSVSLAPKVHCPVLILHGDCDPVVPLALGQQLRAAMAGPTELVVVPGAGHNDVSLAIDGANGPRLVAFLGGD